MSLAKKLAVTGLAILGLRLVLLSGGGESLGARLADLADSGLIAATVGLELGPRASAEPESDTAASDAESRPVFFAASPLPTGTAPVSASPSPSGEPDGDDPAIVETTIYSGLSIKNTTSYEIDVSELMAEPLTQTLPAEGPQILIIHTHTSEAYTPDGQDRYEASDPSRTEDEQYNVVRVGDELAAALESFGLSVLHDRTSYDYPSYTGCYARSGEAVEKYLAEYPDIAVVIDLHRDALSDGDVVYKTMAELDGECASQIMLLCSTGEDGLYHPNWRENLKFALYLQKAVNTKYPTLARPVCVVPERYNQQLSTGSILLEVGSSGNTLQEALTAVRLFADAAGPALLELVAAD